MEKIVSDILNSNGSKKTPVPNNTNVPYAALKDVNKQLERIYINLADVQGTQVNAVTKQTDIKKMIDTESSRLSAKQNTIDQAIQNQQRIIYFNDNSRKIALGYLNVLITIAITLGMVFLVRVLFFHFTKLPNMLFNVLIVAIVSIGILVSFSFYKGILNRNPYNFDELNLKVPHMDLRKSGADGNGVNVGSINGCVGSQCCTPATDEAPGTKWSENQSKCIFAPAGSNISVIDTTITTPPSMTTIPEKFSLMSERQTLAYSPEPSYSLAQTKLLDKQPIIFFHS